MNRKTRRILFFVLVAVFLILTPTLIFYSQGWRMNWDTWTLTRTGALYVKAIPNSAEIYINGVLAKKTDFIFGTALIENLLPDTYLLEIRKDGYQTWKKMLQTTQHEVTEAKHIILFEESISFQGVTDNVLNVWSSPSGNEAIIQRTMSNGRWELVRLSLSNGNESQLLKQIHSAQEVLDVSWSQDGKRILLRLGIGETIEHQVVAFEGSESAACRQELCELSFVAENIEQAAFHPSHPTRLILVKQSGTALSLLEADYETKKTITFFANDIAAFRLRNTDLIWLNMDGTMWQQPLTADTPVRQLLSNPFPTKREIQYKLHLAGDDIFLLEDRRLLHLKGEEFQEVAQGVNNLLVGPDKNKLAISTNSEILIYFLNQQDDQPRHNKGDLLFLTRFSESIAGLQWLGSNYLLFSVGVNIVTAEIDERGTINTAKIGTFKKPELFLWQARNILHVLSQETLFASERLTQ